MSKSTMLKKSGFLSALLGILILTAPVHAETPVREASLSSTPAVASVDVDKELRMLASPDVRSSFPRLQLRYVEVLGPSTRQYNCIAYSLGVNHWVNPMTGDEKNPLEPMDKLYAQEGYVREADMNCAVEPGKEKLVVYAAINPDATIRSVTHAARQEPDGTWTSKLGSLALIRHTTPEALRGPTYGMPVAVYVRTAPLSGL
jgi:hypothetical protein